MIYASFVSLPRFIALFSIILGLHWEGPPFPLSHVQRCQRQVWHVVNVPHMGMHPHFNVFVKVACVLHLDTSVLLSSACSSVAL
jgi:hypothetical protein